MSVSHQSSVTFSRSFEARDLDAVFAALRTELGLKEYAGPGCASNVRQVVVLFGAFRRACLLAHVQDGILLSAKGPFTQLLLLPVFALVFLGGAVSERYFATFLLRRLKIIPR